ncbi:MAG: glutamyl-tRNA reductase [Candidatus Eremiobacteraeota bacterium]|nr:glutamyl-tRNA reductase [Candidatus Eremiobacteraeota bacterium]
MPLVCLGLSHHTAPVAVRERHAFPPSRMSEALTALRDYQAVVEAVMLSTCGRLEIYAELQDYETGVTQLKSFLQNFRHGEVSDLDSYLYTLLGTQAIEHLFRVSTGLDSMLIGEAEILGQIKQAYIQAQKAHSIGKPLHKLFREALHAGKAARTQTRIGEQFVSVASAAVDLAKQHVGPLESKSVLVIGAGKMGRTTAKRLRAEGAGHLFIMSRSSKGVAELIAEVGFGQPVEPGSLCAALAASDIVVTSTGASHFILTPQNVAQGMRERAYRPLFIIDIAVPRDVDPEVAGIGGVQVVDIDGLKNIVESNLETRREAIPFVEQIIAEYIGRFQQWYQSRVAVPVISSLTQRAEAIRKTEIKRLFARCPELTERQRMLVTGMSLTIISKLLHKAVTKIRDKAVSNHSEALSDARILDELFDLRLAEESRPRVSFDLEE